MTKSVVTPALLEEHTRMGSAIEVVSEVLHREYEFEKMRYFCDYGDRGWVISKIEPRRVFTPEPPPTLTEYSTWWMPVVAPRRIGISCAGA